MPPDCVENIHHLLGEYQKAFLASEDLTSVIDALNRAGSKREEGKRFWLSWDSDEAWLVMYKEKEDLGPLVLSHLASVTWLVIDEDLVCTKHRESLSLDMTTLTHKNSAKLGLLDLKKRYP
jgi:hypothetical protein